jgi:hypothetical protein
MTDTVNLPAKAKLIPNLPADLKEELAAEAANIKERIGAPAGDYIGVDRNKSFRLPGSDQAGAVLEVVVIDFVAVHQYYPGKYNDKDIKPPVCMAVGHVVKDLKPFDNVPNPQDKLDGKPGGCAACKQNQWKSDPGGNGKACKNQRMLAVVAPDDPTGALMLLKVSPTGTKYWDAYASKIANSGGAVPHPMAVITRISFDPGVDYPSLRFEVAGLNPVMNECGGRRREARERLLAKPDLGLKAAA